MGNYRTMAKYTEQHWMHIVLNEYNEGLRLVPADQITYRVCAMAVFADPSNIKHVPQCFKVKILCSVAFEAHRFSVEHYTPEMFTQAFCRWYLNTYYDALEYIQYMPPQLITEEMCYENLQLLSEDRETEYVLQYIPEKFRSRRICKFTVRRNGLNLEYVPDNLKDEEMCRLALEKTMRLDTVDFVPEKYKTKEMWAFLAARYGDIFHKIPPDMIDAEICQLVAWRERQVIRNIPDRFKFLSVYAILDSTQDRVCDRIFRSMPTNFWQPDICWHAAYIRPITIGAIPKDRLTQTICNIFMEAYPSLLRFIPEKFITPHMCRAAVETHGYHLKFVPKHLKTTQMCIVAVKNDYRNLNFIPAHLIDRNICQTVLLGMQDICIGEFIDIIQNHCSIILIDKKLIFCADTCNIESYCELFFHRCEPDGGFGWNYIIN